MRYADVAVHTGQPARKPFTYVVPAGMDVALGQAVFVPFGPRILQGIVVGLPESTTLAEVRPIHAIAEVEPVLDGLHVGLATWMSGRYLAPLWECVAACLPPGYGQRPVTMVAPVAVPPLLPVYPQDQRILQYIAAHGRVTMEALRDAVGGVTLQRLQRLQRDGLLTVVEGLTRPAVTTKFERRVALLRPAAEAAEQAAALEAKSQRSVAARVLRLLASAGDVPLAATRELGAGPKHIEALAAGGWLRQYEAEVERDPLAAYRFEHRGPPTLTVDQESAVGRIVAGQGQEWLVHGVTGAGKTEVYLELVRHTLERGDGALVLVPEIALTPQAIRRYGERFGSVLTVLHSGLSPGEAFDQWHRVRRGEARLVIGSRSAVFAPLPRLGLIVIDEEHEWTYKQADPAPRYHTREVARYLSRETGATLVLGSATPDIVTYHGTEVGAASRIDLLERVAPTGDGGTAPGRLPQVTIVDMREELKQGNRSVFSRPLYRAVRMALGRGEQTILFVNRRGAARFMLCRACGHVPACPSCEVAMGLDDSEPAHPRLRCHHCGRARRLEDGCPACGSGAYRPFGAGTQRIEAEAREAFPMARVARWDSDAASRKGSHAALVRALEAGEIDILVGTQILAKGLDLGSLTVVGVIDADVGLNLPDYRAHERAFQLLSQVAGRAGRRDVEGQVFIQTYQPEAPPIVCAAGHDYRAFYEHEIAHRRRAGYPPFSRLVRLVVRSKNRERGLAEATRVADELRLERDVEGRADPDVLGPTPPYIARLRGQYRWQIVLRGRDPAALVARVRLGDHWTIDVDPEGLL
jgi:primosomal protein N' (replication factor Y)